MSSEPPPPPQRPQRALSARNRITSSSQDVPAQGRLADVSRGTTPALTREGNLKSKFVPKVVPRKSAESTSTAATGGSLLTDKSKRTLGPPGAGASGRGRGRGRPESIGGISGPFALGPAMPSGRSRRDTRAHGSSLTVEKAPVEGGTPSLSGPSTSTSDTVKREGETSKKPATPRDPTVAKTKVKREEDDGFDSPNEEEADERIDLSELNFPGGPVSSRRRNDRIARGWKKIELWIEQEDAEVIVLDDEPTLPPGPKQVAVKVEDDNPTEMILPAPEPMELDEDLGLKSEVTAERRARRRRKSLKGKSREEKEEMAREELDLEVIKDHFSGEDGSERDRKLFLLQMPLTLPPLKSLAETEVKEEIKAEDPAASASLSPAVLPSGKLGQLRIHASGKAVLSYGGVEFIIRLASDVAFAQEFVAIHPYEEHGGKAWRLGSVGQGQEGGWLIGVPELNGIGKHG